METKLNIKVSDSIKVKPDTAILSIKISNKDERDLEKHFIDASKVGSEKISETLELLDKYDLKEKASVGRLNISPYKKREVIETKKALAKEVKTSYEDKLVGYSYIAFIEVELPADYENLSKLYTDLVSRMFVSSVDVSYDLKNVEEHKDKLMKLLLTKARHKAKVIAEASNMSIEGIADITLGNAYNNINYRLMCNSANFDSCDDYYEEVLDEMSNYFEAAANTERELSESMDIKFILV